MANTSINQQQIVSTIISSYRNDTPIYSIAKAFFSNAKNSAVIEKMVEDIGMPQYQGNNGCNCGWPLYLYYYYAYYLTLYPEIDNSSNCSVLEGYLISLDVEAKNLDKAHLPGGMLTDDGDYRNAMQALSLIMSKANAKYATLNCKTNITNQQSELLANQINDAGSSAISGGTSNIGTYIVYAIAVIIAIVGIKFLFKK